MRLKAGKLDRRIRIERPIADTSPDGAGSGTWALVAKVWAEVQDLLPSRAPDEQISGGFSTATQRTRVRIRYRAGITPDMRIVTGGRIMQIVSGPAEIGRRDGLEFMVADYTPAGNPA